MQTVRGETAPRPLYAPTARAGGLTAAHLVLLAMIPVALGLLLAPLRLPIGVGNWDIVMYLDAGYRIDHGQMPDRDFFVPFGPLSVYAYWLAATLFPNAHPILAAQLPYAFLCLPLILVVLSDVRPRLGAVLIAAAFAVLALHPANLFQRYVQSSADGFGIYNREAGLVLFVMVASLWWGRRAWRIAAVMAVALVFLFLTKITAFAAAWALVGYAFVMGRIGLREVAAIVAAVAVALGALEVSTGLVSAYLADVRGMISLNDGGALRRIGATISEQPPTLLGLAALIGACLVRDRRALLVALGGLPRRPFRAVRVIANLPAVILSFLTVFAILIESQNSGSQEYAFLLPAVIGCIAAGAGADWWTRAARFAAIALVFFTGLKVIERAARFTATGLRGEAIAIGEPDPFRLVTKDVFLDQARMWPLFRGEWGAVYSDIERQGFILTQPTFYDRIDFQVSFVQSVAEAARDLDRWSEETGTPIETVASLDFVDPIALLTGRPPVPGLAVVMDPYRTVYADLHRRLLERWAQTDGLLVPHCPPAMMRLDIAALAAPELEQRRKVALNGCWDLYVKPSAE